MWREAAFLIERRITGWIIQGTSASVFAELEEKSHPFSPLMSSAMKKHTDKGLTIAIDSFHWYMLSCFILSLCSLNNQTWLCSNPGSLCEILQILHDDVIKWKHFPRYWPFVRGIHRSPVNSPHKVQWSGVFMFFYLCLNERLSKQPCGWWLETPSWSLWCHCNGYIKLMYIVHVLLWFRYRPILIASALQDYRTDAGKS